MTPLQTIRTKSRRVACDGSGDGIPPSLGHPVSWLEIGASGFVDCGYCDRHFVLVDEDAEQDMPGDIEADDEDVLGR